MSLVQAKLSSMNISYTQERVPCSQIYFILTFSSFLGALLDRSFQEDGNSKICKELKSMLLPLTFIKLRRQSHRFVICDVTQASSRQ